MACSLVGAQLAKYSSIPMPLAIRRDKTTFFLEKAMVLDQDENLKILFGLPALGCICLLG